MYKIFQKYFDFVVLVSISFGFILLMSFDINSWYYSAIGDEYGGFYFARSIFLNNIPLSIIPSNTTTSIFSQIGFSPVSFSLYQALVMKIFGLNHAGWVMSSILIVVFTFWFFYLYVKDLFGSTVAFLSLFILASSHYLWAFSHLAYWNVNAIFPLVASFFFFFRGFKQKRWIFFFLAGIFSALGFYSFYSSRVTIFFLTLFLVFNFRKSLHQKTNIVLFYIGFFILFIPFILVNKTEIIRQMLLHSMIGSNNYADNQRIYLFYDNLVNSFGAFYKGFVVQHFVSGPLVDSVTITLFSLGLIMFLFSIKKYYFIIIWLLTSFIIAGGLSEYTTISVTRLLFLLPIISLMAGYCLNKFYQILKKKCPPYVSVSVTIVILTIIFLLNIYRFYIITPKKMDITPEAITIGALQNILPCQPRATVIFRYADPVLKPALESYNLIDSTRIITDPKMILQMNLISEKCLIFSQPDADKEIIDTTSQLVSNTITENKFEKIEFFSPSKKKYVVVFIKKII